MAMESKRVEVLGMGFQATDYVGEVKLLGELAQHRPDYARVLAGLVCRDVDDLAFGHDTGPASVCLSRWPHILLE